MLLRLYEPILWRSLAAANPHVRKNAATLLIDAFPLHNPDRCAPPSVITIGMRYSDKVLRDRLRGQHAGGDG